MHACVCVRARAADERTHAGRQQFFGGSGAHALQRLSTIEPSATVKNLVLLSGTESSWTDHRLQFHLASSTPLFSRLAHLGRVVIDPCPSIVLDPCPFTVLDPCSSTTPLFPAGFAAFLGALTLQRC